MSPYVAWVAFATALNARIWKDNPNAQDIDDTLVEPPADVKEAGKDLAAAAASATKAAKTVLTYK
ncbi:hypothetical protein HaLaN_07199 [Haematococcus lacustris]|nr:hypothetical protein HaLaN_07199 [Haematococcus lacustris]